MATRLVTIYENFALFYRTVRDLNVRRYLSELGCALTFAAEAKFEIEAKNFFRLEAKKSLISHDSLPCETPKT